MDMLDASMLSYVDTRNVALQRTSTLLNSSFLGGRSPSYLAWNKFKTNALLDLEVRWRKQTILSEAFDRIRQEFDLIQEELDLSKVRRACDIGCGLGVINAYLANHCGLDEICLIDIEETQGKYHDYSEHGSGYSSLRSAKEFIEANVGYDVLVTPVNPNKKSIDLILGKFDLISSYRSCGFHYPVDGYIDFFEQKLSETGMLILDLRVGEDHSRLDESFKVFKVLEDTPKHCRVVYMKR